VFATPFTNNTWLLIYHFITIPFVVLHWILNNNTCALTLLEHYIRSNGYTEDFNIEQCVTYKLISPIYDFNKDYNTYSNFIYTSTLGLWLITCYKLYHKKDELINIKNLLVKAIYTQ
jgi:hypothetical protein